MSLVDQLKQVIRDQKFGTRDADVWIKEWLFESPMNRGRLIPANAPVTLIKGLQILFEYPWRAICEIAEVAARERDGSPNIAAYICVSDSGMTDVLVVDIVTGKVILFWRKEAWKFRFKNLKEIDDWMEEQVIAILKALGKEDKWAKSPRRQRPLSPK